ncbi:NEAT domain-containing protein [Leuconostoc lactis]|uniref:NEAT domain-containing protein n=1 Tax=Leuconostoc lactis TaxID=1246 RepID=UPI001D10207F|nr:NEAT domain-containing protein [Leuconostoc lactis]MCC2744109.1 NEAT domain-containing protein [Leuconostoc lactis]MCC2754564.1 NEAT domain-containing protein [Leuconostoc lactis]
MFKKIIFGCLVGAIVGTANMTSVQAQAVPYQVLKYSTHDVSYASAYFVTPGDLVPAGDQYRAQLVIATQHELGRFPVTILTINQQKPTVTQSTQGNTDYYTFSFLVKNPNTLLSGTMKVDVASLNYHHTYDFNLQFDAKNLPAVAQPATAASATGQAQPTAPASASQTHSSSNTTAAASSQQVVPSANSSSVQPAVDQPTPAATSSSAEVSAAQPAPVAKAATATHQRHQQAPLWPAALAGVLLGGLGIVGHMIWTKKRQKVG